MLTPDAPAETPAPESVLAQPWGRRRWQTIGEQVAAQHTQLSATAPDHDWLPRPLGPKNFRLPLPTYERTPYRVWAAIEQRAQAVPWFRIAENIGVAEPVLRSWLRRLAAPPRPR